MSLKNNTVAVVDYGMAICVRSRRRCARPQPILAGTWSSRPIPMWSMPPTAWSCLVRGPCLTACASCANRACSRPCSMRLPTSRCSASAWACGDAARPQRRRRCWPLGPIPAMCASSISKAECRPMATVQGAANGLEPGQQTQQGGKPHALWAGIPDGSSTTLCTAFMRRCNTARIARPRPTMAASLYVPSRR